MSLVPRWLARRSRLRTCQWMLLGVLVVLIVPMLYSRSNGSQNRVDEDNDILPLRRIDDGPGVNSNNNNDPSAAYRHLNKDTDWHDYALMEADKKRVGPGEQGQSVSVPAAMQELQQAMYRVNGYDALASDMIALDRSVKDIRHGNCRSAKYISKLPTVSVIFPFHNEHNSTLLRSVWSIINRSPKDVLKQIILVDDASTKEFLKQPLLDYIKAANIGHIVQVVRTEKREGLIRGRQIGARCATAEVMVFLDAHSEANYNWLPPLVEPIALDYRTVVCPFVDVVDCDTYEYKAQDEGARGSWDWEFHYKRLPRTDLDGPNADPSQLFDSPVMAGGYFAISTKWFWELGGYDEGLDIWGGEQYELSFKVWQCHGRMVDAPCSRVGHIYRCKYQPFPNPHVGDFISRNYKRVALVWMDEYAEYLYERSPSIRNVDPLDLTKQKAVREKLQCKSFKWFMEHVAYDQDKYYPAVEPPNGALGRIENDGHTGYCVTSRTTAKDEKVSVSQCGSGGAQEMRFSFWRDVRPSGSGNCLDVSTSVPKAPVVLFPCHGMQGNQEFRYRKNTKQVFHPLSNQCLDMVSDGNQLFMEPCDTEKKSQMWSWQNVNWTVISSWKEKGL